MLLTKPVLDKRRFPNTETAYVQALMKNPDRHEAIRWS